MAGIMENWAIHPNSTAFLEEPIRAKSCTVRVHPIRHITRARALVTKRSDRAVKELGKEAPIKPAIRTEKGKNRL